MSAAHVRREPDADAAALTAATLVASAVAEALTERGTAHVARGTRALFTYDQWMLQRVLDAYLAAADVARATIQETLQDIGAAELLTLALPQRVIRRNYQLVRQSQV